MRLLTSLHPAPLRRTLAHAIVLAAVAAAPAGAVISERISSVALSLPASLEPQQLSFCTWGACYLTPRLYHAPLADGRTLIGWTDASMNGHVSVVSGSAITTTFDFAGRPVRGLVGHDDGSFAVLLWERGAAGMSDDVMWLSRRNAAGAELWAARATSTTNVPSAAANDVGDSRLVYGGGVYGAYLSVHGISGFAAGHEGDEYARVDSTGTAVSGGWSWGLSHSMAQLVGWHPESAALVTVGVSDCYPGKGVYAGSSRLVWTSDGDCNGDVQAQLGQMAAVSTQRWLVAFNAPDRPGFPASGIGLARIAPSGTPAVTWLTAASGAEERDPVLARIGASLASDRLLVGWRMQTSGESRLAVIDTLGTILEGPEVASPAAQWGVRDDPLRTRADGSVSWVRGAAGSSTLTLYRYSEPPVGVERTPDAPLALGVLPAYPNPLRGGEARLRFRLAESRTVTVRVLDGAGRQVCELHRGWLPRGAHELGWDGRDASGAPVASGLYFCTLESGGRTSTSRLAVIR